MNTKKKLLIASAIFSVFVIAILAADPLVGGVRVVPRSAVSDTAYDASNWNGDTNLATKNAIRDKVEAMLVGGGIGTGDIDTSAELRTILTDETGTGALLFAGGNLGAATATDDPYDATSWNGSTGVPTKNAVRDKIESLSTGASGVEATFDGGGVPIVVGTTVYKYVKTGFTITEVTMGARESGSIVVDIYKCSYADFDAGATHPVSGDKITASAPPTISSAVKSQDSTLTGWTTATGNGVWLAFVVTSCSGVTWVNISVNP